MVDLLHPEIAAAVQSHTRRPFPTSGAPDCNEHVFPKGGCHRHFWPQHTHELHVKTASSEVIQQHIPSGQLGLRKLPLLQVHVMGWFQLPRLSRGQVSPGSLRVWEKVLADRALFGRR